MYSDISELERIREEVIMVYFKVLPRHSPGVTEGNHDNCQSGQSVPRSRFQQGTSQIQVGTVTTSINLVAWLDIIGFILSYMLVWSPS
jgi:hypothetical protein